MLLRNGTVLNQYPLKQLGGGVHADITMSGRSDQRNIYSGISDKKSGIPNGHGSPSAWLLPRQPGGMSSINYAVARFTPTAAILSGFPITGSTSFAVDVSGTGGLITSGTGTSSFAVSVANAQLIASLSGTASTTFAITGDALLDGHGFMEAAGSFVLNGALTSYAVGHMAGDTVDDSVLTVDSIAAGVLAAASTAPIAADIKKVNAYTVSGDGQSGTEWGPV